MQRGRPCKVNLKLVVARKNHHGGLGGGLANTMQKAFCLATASGRKDTSTTRISKNHDTVMFVVPDKSVLAT